MSEDCPSASFHKLLGVQIRLNLFFNDNFFIFHSVYSKAKLKWNFKELPRVFTALFNKENFAMLQKIAYAHGYKVNSF